MKNLFLIFLLAVTTLPASAQYWTKSPRYGYRFQVPKGFSSSPIIGRNVDLKIVDKYGNSVVIVVKTLPVEAANMNLSFMSESSNEEVVQGIRGTLDNVTLIKRGFEDINGVKSYCINYTHGGVTSPVLYVSSYNIIRAGRMYNISTTCGIDERNATRPYFYQAVHSFAF